MFYQYEEADLAIGQIPKAGLDTFREWLGKDYIVVPNDKVIVSRRVAFFRHPTEERLPSCYSHMYWMQQYGKGNKHHADTTSWEAFIDYIFEHEDEHWRPQVEHVGGAPNIYHRFENLTDHWEKYRPGILPHNNKMTRLPTNNYRASELFAKYADDLNIWSDAT